jgi:hypothetical protein
MSIIPRYEKKYVMDRIDSGQDTSQLFFKSDELYQDGWEIVRGGVDAG